MCRWKYFSSIQLSINKSLANSIWMQNVPTMISASSRTVNQCFLVSFNLIKILITRCSKNGLMFWYEPNHLYGSQERYWKLVKVCGIAKSNWITREKYSNVPSLIFCHLLRRAQTVQICRIFQVMKTTMKETCMQYEMFLVSKITSASGRSIRPASGQKCYRSSDTLAKAWGKVIFKYFGAKHFANGHLILGGDGIRQPISAKIYLPGKSLDFNMEHNERVGRKTVEEESKRESLKQQRINDRLQSSSSNVFNFLNNTICKINPASASSTANSTTKSSEVKTQSGAQLNIYNFKLDEEVKKIEKSLQQLKESSKRRSTDRASLKNLNHQISLKEIELSVLKGKQLEIDREQRMRKDKSKLTIFWIYFLLSKLKDNVKYSKH